MLDPSQVSLRSVERVAGGQHAALTVPVPGRDINVSAARFATARLRRIRIAHRSTGRAVAAR